MDGLLVGPMPVAQFFDKFMKVDDRKLKLRLDNGDSVLQAWLVEKDWSEAVLTQNWIEHFNKHQKHYFLNIKMKYTGAKPAPHARSKPDLCGYKRSASATDREPLKWPEIDLCGEFKTDDWKDCFHLYDKPEKASTKPPTATAEDVMGQIATYISYINRFQYRVHHFQLLVCGSTARLLRWDHSGCVFSESIDYSTLKGAQQLMEFITRYCMSNPEQRGYDARFGPLPQELLTHRMEAERVLAHYAPPKSGQPRPMVALKLKLKDGEVVTVIVVNHIRERKEIVGRASRGMPVYDPLTGKVYFCKDSWIVFGGKQVVEPEYVVLQKLNDSGVVNVPTLKGGEDTKYVTSTFELVSQEWNCAPTGKSMVPRKLVYVVVEEVGRPLETCESIRITMKVLLDAFKGHEGAYNLRGYIHRDVSMGNVVVMDDEGPDKKPRGLLIDWERAKTENAINNEGGAQPSRSGTWEFMSAKLSRHPRKPHQLQDDIESFVHLALYTTTRYWGIFRNDEQRMYILKQIYQRFLGVNTATKMLLLTPNEREDLIGEDIINYDGLQAFKKLLDTAFRYCHQWFESQYARFNENTLQLRDKTLPIPNHIHIHNHAELRELWDTSIEDRANWKEDIKHWDYLLDREAPSKPPALADTPAPAVDGGAGKRKRGAVYEEKAEPEQEPLGELLLPIPNEDEGWEAVSEDEADDGDLSFKPGQSKKSKKSGKKAGKT